MIHTKMRRSQIEMWWTIVDIAGIGSPVPYEIWKKTHGNIEAFCFEELRGRRARIRYAFYESDPPKRYRSLLKSLSKDTFMIAIDSPLYPQKLLDLDVPPLFLFAKGSIGALDNLGVGVVGTRRPDAESLRLVERIVEENAVNKHTIISGGAIGIDGAAHHFALQYETPTIVVSPSGIERLTPRSNLPIFEKIPKHGGIILSEYLPFSEPRKFHFHRRNMLLAGLSDEVIIVRATSRSGTMITAKAALKLKRPLYAVPGSPLDPRSAGCLELIANGDAKTFLFKQRKEKKARKPQTLNPLERKIYTALGSPMQTDELLKVLSDLSSGDILATLTMLEMSGWVEKCEHTGGYRRT